MNTKPSLSLLVKTWLPIAVGFIFFRLMTQIDLVMLTPFGADYIASFGVPTKIMLFDLLAAFSIGPVASIFLAQAKTTEDRARHAGQILTLSFLIAVGITAIGLIVYPLILHAIVASETISDAASVMLFWYTVAIPFRLTHFVQSMIHHGIGQGKTVLVIDAVGLLLNAPLNFLLIKLIGVQGIFVSTFLLSGLTSFLFFLNLRRTLHLNRFHLFSCNFTLLRKFARYVVDEFLRLCLQFGHGFLIITVLGLVTSTAPHILTSFSASSEMAQIILFVFIAIMRSVAVISARSEASLTEIARDWQKIAAYVVIAAIILGGIIGISSMKLGEHVYLFDNKTLNWWTVYLVYFSLALPIISLNSFYRGMFQSKKQFAYMTKIETIAKWLIGLPVFFLGIKFQSPLVAWSYLFVSELVEFGLYSATLYFPHARISAMLHAKSPQQHR